MHKKKYINLPYNHIDFIKKVTRIQYTSLLLLNKKIFKITLISNLYLLIVFSYIGKNVLIPLQKTTTADLIIKLLKIDEILFYCIIMKNLLQLFILNKRAKKMYLKSHNNKNI
ncbi:hypothetical protein EDEG_03509 [Edhazardia aedis USNM 41457]|uniref:Uncharacterized protein n=1 Tax=Edhazardia aedis (strain USNM 41457) TaxID=1003232 RepID=J9D2K8_EDHAE|nr:hypothetical protein EDEG_03509 [Edhazardia aedis USNM 41457]|eukprot:EJW02041.1 hypothetical protein EDEG_03509 [Edhazardia aedis USNM 41457]